MVNLTNVYLKVKEFCNKSGLYCSRYHNNIPDSVITIRVEKSFFNSKNYHICKSTPLDDGELTELIINDIKRSFNIKDESNKTMKNVIFNYPSTTIDEPREKDIEYFEQLLEQSIKDIRFI